MPAVPLILTLISQLVRSRVIAGPEIEAMAKALDGDGDHDAATMMRGAYIEALAEPEPLTLRIVPSDGGNGTA